jgi:hypothetical protein
MLRAPGQGSCRLEIRHPRPGYGSNPGQSTVRVASGVTRGVSQLVDRVGRCRHRPTVQRMLFERLPEAGPLSFDDRVVELLVQRHRWLEALARLQAARRPAAGRPRAIVDQGVM